MNSLYGRFGMDSNFSDSSIMENEEFNAMMDKISIKKLKLIEDIKIIGDDHKLVSINNDQTDTMFNSVSETHNINIAIASAITSLARIEMSKFKNNPQIKLYYTDTDSVFVDLNPKQLDDLFPCICGNDIGQLKLEYKINKAIFLGPKAYFLELDNEKKIVKIKGLNRDVVKAAVDKDLDFNKFYGLLFKEASVNLYQKKWYKNISNGSIEILLQSYEIKHNSNKRQLIYDKNNKLIATTPYVINPTYY